MASSHDQVTAAADPAVVATAAAVHAERIRTVYRQSVGLLLVNPLNAAVVALVLWPTRRPSLLAGWVAACAAVTALRALHRHQYLRTLPPTSETDVWARRLVIGAVLSGVLWGLAVLLFYETGVLGPQLLLVFVVGGMIAGASGTLALHLPAFLGFTAAAVVPTAARMLAEGDLLHIAMSGLAMVFGVAMALLAANTNRAVTEAFRLRFEKQHLLARLSDAQVSLAEANRTLEKRVAERGAALERQTEALRDAQRMESVGLLAGGIAHDFNNLLTVVMGNVSLLGEADLSAQQRDRLDEVHRAAARGANLVSQLLAFSRRQVMVRRVVDLNVIVAEVQPLLGRLIGAHIQLAVPKTSQPLPVKADPTQLQQVIINLATNARDAMDAGGTLTIETALVEGAVAGTSFAPGRYVVLSVRDTGVGMTADTRRMAFHPFFTTKEVGRGTGLGLATVYGIVEQSDGHISVDSEPGRGSCFRFYLPLAATENVEVPVSLPESPSAPATGSATILVAEDDTMVRAVTARILSTAGYTVIEAADGEQALAIIRGHAGLIDLLISDVVMPTLGGAELAKRVSAERPEIRILLVTGYDPEGMPILDDRTPPVEFVQKPFTPAVLRTKVATMLAGSARPSMLSNANDARRGDFASL